jgi:hypothetical protein
MRFKSMWDRAGGDEHDEHRDICRWLRGLGNRGKDQEDVVRDLKTFHMMSLG